MAKATATNHAGHLARAQDRYCLAKAICETAREQYLRLVAELPKLTSADYADTRRLESYCQHEIEIAEQTGYRHAQATLALAEQNLFNWTQAVMETLPRYRAERERIAIVWSKSHSPRMREKLVDICMRLRVAGGGAS